MILYSIGMNAQKKTITGIVTDETKEPLAGVVITIKGTLVGAVTDFDGKFKIKASIKDTLICSYIGLKNKEIIIDEDFVLNIKMEEDLASLEDLVLGCFFGGYKEELPFKIYKIRNENFVTQQDVYNAIRAEVPNVQITNTQAQETPTITMRGDDNTIVIIDGIRTTIDALHSLNPSSIETIEVSNNTAATNYLLTPRN